MGSGRQMPKYAAVMAARAVAPGGNGRLVDSAIGTPPPHGVVADAARRVVDRVCVSDSCNSGRLERRPGGMCGYGGGAAMHLGLYQHGLPQIPAVASTGGLAGRMALGNTRRCRTIRDLSVHSRDREPDGSTVRVAARCYSDSCGDGCPMCPRASKPLYNSPAQAMTEITPNMGRPTTTAFVSLTLDHRCKSLHSRFGRADSTV